jgi:hypothetical protein
LKWGVIVCRMRHSFVDNNKWIPAFAGMTKRQRNDKKAKE